MEIDRRYIDALLAPLDGERMLTLSEYIKEIEGNGVSVDGPDGRIDNKFDRHLRYLSSKSMIVNPEGFSDLKSLGFTIGAGGHASIIGHLYIMKNEENINTSSVVNNISIGGNFSGNLQSGEVNSLSNISISQLKESLEKSDTPESRSILAKLNGVLSHPLTQSIIGAF